MLLSTVYPIAFLGALLGIIAWTSWSKNGSVSSLARGVFMLGFVLWGLSLITSDLGAETLMFAAFRDLIVLGLAGTLAILTRSNRVLSVGLLFAAMVFMQSTYFSIMKEGIQPRQSQLDASGELLIQLNDEASIEDLEKVLDVWTADVRIAFAPKSPEITQLDNIYVIDIPTQQLSRIEEIKAALRTFSGLDWLEENEVISVPMEIDAQTVSDDYLKGLTNDPHIDKLWAFEPFQVGELHQLLSSKLVQPEKKALVAILDTGVDGKHEDLQANFKSIQSKYDRDVKGHGTHCAGIVAAVTNNGKGVASFDPDGSFVQITSIKVLSDLGFGSQEGTIKGMIEAADMGADVISMSLGAPSTDERQRAYSEAVEYCQKKGAIVVVSAGNSNVNARDYSPANTPGVIAVSSVDANLNKSPFSNSLQDIQYSLAAPGQNIYSTFPNNRYRSMNGTSMSAPYVSGIVAILKSLQPDLRTDQAYEILSKTGKATGAPAATGALIQPAAAVRMILD